MTMDELKSVIEALIFAADHPLSLDRIAGVLEGEDKAEIKKAVAGLMEDYRGGGEGASRRGIYIEEVAGGFQLRTRADYAPFIKKLFKIGLQKMSKASLETLAIVAYRQPLTRADLEAVRGVDSAGVLKTLLERRLIKIVGRKEIPGRPVVYGTTKEFLETFNLADLSSLPTLKEMEALDEAALAEEYLGGENIGGLKTPEATDEGKTAEDNSAGGDNLQTEGGGTDTGGESKA